MLGKNEVREILQSRFANDKHTKLSEIPLPSQLKDIYKAALRIKTAIDENERIAVVGDYDVDGIVSTVIMSDFFNQIGADYVIKIPNRFTDGYGLNNEIIDELEGIGLIVTVDNGTSAIEAAQICAKKGIDLIITDHHMPPPVLPEAYAIVNPKQPDCTFPNIEICGAQVAWYLVGALKETLGVNYDMSSLMDILIIAIIADMMELRDMNRALLRYGIKKLNNSNRACFKAIKEHYFKKHFEFDDISYTIAPLINCTGRMDDATMSYKFLCARDIREANQYLKMIDHINNSRKEEEKALYEQIAQSINEDDNIIVVWGDEWHEGIIGIVASRLSKTYKKPAIVFSVHEDRAKGSARSVGKFDILNLISSQAEILTTYGGHKGAAGVGIEPANLEEFRRRVNAKITPDDLEDFRAADDLLGELEVSQIDFELLEILEFFEPYGQKNPKPVFNICGASVGNVRQIGKEGKHIKMSIQKNGASVEALWFNYDFLPRENQRVDLIFSINKNNFRSVISPELVIKQMSPAE
ncbi:MULTISPECIES: single-stranded-DNA-specific exonuclease RecJ [unclassified Campylobacter]|uniref:single-stranded-DNA-specific exonuclease RecJ n=1 Tax=unclassified Campylobacter TaxID=2593542 RepID=UPI0022EA03F6|nr:MULTISPECIES: single-stranded-DNA-specific exonuclease RecJ [unclassified Campylobacter]MDA3054698.1 single-stranded-DNA-specific exonuclease RecJ [Campylobacter sp. VBCF_07 NA4]MDA3061268.1 single-stranded-DNA-specific exonuclease RecJ [Campylobacter sp. VBCF_02 NA5]MDA3070648.1 single-stranded-DNA-specific exonuclease RecJ [Campylobacter sp. VBCF_08 NA3]WBR54154.1 single-stranded-DNA-specific exonuclease RecJ [Campylobacter sp. VBCF_01 NA2]